MAGLNVSVEAVSPALARKAHDADEVSGGSPNTGGSEAEQALLAAVMQDRLVDAIMESGQRGEPIAEFGLSDGNILRFYFSIYVTNANLEPVTGLTQESFVIKHLLIPAAVFNNFDAETTFWESDLPGVYRMNQKHPAAPFGADTFGISVRRRKPTRPSAGRALQTAEFDSGFCMTTAVRGAASHVSG